MASVFRIHHGPFGHVSITDLRDDLAEHAHSTLSLSFWMSGSASCFSVGGSTLQRSPRQAILINSFVAHSVKAASDDAPTRSLVFYFSPEWLRRRLPEGVASNFEWLDLPVSPATRARIWALGEMLCDEDADEDQLNAEIDDALTWVLTAARPNAGNAGAEARRLYDFRVRKAIAFMCEDLAAGSGMEKLARASGISRPHLFAVFREQMNLTPRVLWNTLRLEAAKTQLGGSGESLSRIAHALGFNSACNFTRFFKQHTGVTPSTYKSAVAVRSRFRSTSIAPEGACASLGSGYRPIFPAAGLLSMLSGAYR
jgi:AraC-like DNA-binding protein